MSDKPTFETLSVLFGPNLARRMLAAPALPTIRAAITNCATPILERPVYLNRDIADATFSLRQPMRQRLYADVPLCSIVGLDHKNFAPGAMTWRTLLAGLHGVGWGPATLRYFEGEIGDKSFPAPGAAYPLRLQAWGGAITCANGMHRLVAAICWLASQHGMDAVLRKVDVAYRPVNSAAVTLMVKANERRESVAVAHLSESDDGDARVLIRFDTPDGPRYRIAEGSSIRPAKVPEGWVDRLRRRIGLPPADSFDWQRVSPTVIAALANDGWLRGQLAQPRYEDQPV